jgi:hypothetical protein
MAEESGSTLGAVSKVVPSIYYDLIARVCAGVPFLVVLLWPHRNLFGEITWSKLAILLGAGYVVGMLLTPLSLPWLLVHGLKRYGFRLKGINFKEGESGTDEIAAKDKEAGETLSKMQAEALLCENLFSGFALLLILNRWCFTIPLISCCDTSLCVGILLLLGVCSVHRILAYITRETRLRRMLCQRPARQCARSDN